MIKYLKYPSRPVGPGLPPSDRESEVPGVSLARPGQKASIEAAAHQKVLSLHAVDIGVEPSSGGHISGFKLSREHKRLAWLLEKQNIIDKMHHKLNMSKR